MAAREAFNLYARGEATLNGDNLFTALRCCSVNPTSDEIMAVRTPVGNPRPCPPAATPSMSIPAPWGAAPRHVRGRSMKPHCGHCMP